MPEWRDPFAEPNTIPAGWDVSKIATNDTSARSDRDDSQPSQAGSSQRLSVSLN